MLLGDDAVHPWWLERQLDPASASFVPGGGGEPPANVTHRDWVLVGTLAATERATVDPRGLVTPVEGGFSLDWWVGAADRWHLPSREVAVRQRLLDGTPVTETAMRVPQGDVVHRAFAVRDAEGGSAVVVEIENRSAVAVAVALVVRAWGPTGPTRVGRIAVEGQVVDIDDRPAMVLSRPPAVVHLATAADGGVHPAVISPTPPARDDRPDPVVCPHGGAEAALVVPVPHTALLRAVLPLPATSGRPSRGRQASRPALPDPLPTAEQVARGWQVQGQRGARFELPDERLREVVEANRRHLLLVHAGEDLSAVPTVPFDYTDAAAQLGALAAMGFADEAAQVLATYGERQALDGHMLGDDRRWEANGAALQSLATYWRLTGDVTLPEALVGPVAKAAHWIDRRRNGRRGRRSGEPTGRLPDGAVPAWLGPPCAAFRTDWWSLRGLRDAAALLAAVGQHDAAGDAQRGAADLEAVLADAVASAAGPLGGVVPAAPSRGVDGGIVAIVDAVLLGVIDPDSPFVTATLEALRSRYLADRAVVHAVGALGVSPRLTARLGRAELARGERSALDRLAWLVDNASPVFTWPEVVHPRTGGGSAGAGHDGVVVAELLLLVRELLAREEPDGLVLGSVVPDAWLGQSWSVQGLPTTVGMLGYAVRWHGDRAALLWELEPWPGQGPVRIRAPCLDPAWSTDQPRGEALLGPVVPSGGAGPGDGEIDGAGAIGSVAATEVGFPPPGSRRRAGRIDPPGERSIDDPDGAPGEGGAGSFS